MAAPQLIREGSARRGLPGCCSHRRVCGLLLYYVIPYPYTPVVVGIQSSSPSRDPGIQSFFFFFEKQSRILEIISNPGILEIIPGMCVDPKSECPHSGTHTL
jgi:hypothetical protein